MNPIKCISLGAAGLFTIFLTGCETTKVSDQEGNQETKRMAAIERLRQQPRHDEATENLWNAQDARLDRDSNPMRAY